MLVLALRRNGQAVILKADLDVLLLEARKVSFQLEGVAGVGDVGLYLAGSSSSEVAVEEGKRIHNSPAGGIRHKFKHDQNLHVINILCNVFDKLRSANH